MIEQYDFISIGDTVTDAFIKLKEAEVHCDINKANCTLCMRFGDKIPYEDVFIVPAVGNAANASVSAARLGLASALVANIGGDYYGKEVMEALTSERVGTEFVSVHQNKKTNYHYVLWYEAERTILIKHEEYQYNLPDIGTPKWIYFSSVNERAFPFHYIVADYLEAHPEIKF